MVRTILFETDQYWTVGLQEVTGNIEAHQPYIVCPTKSKMTFKGCTIVKLSQDVTVDPEAGREYAFTKGNFVRKLAGYSTILRAYLLAPADIEENPSQINVKIIGTDYEPFAIASINEVEGEDGGTLAIKRPLIFLMNGNHNGSWKDIKGRNLNGKPSAKGVYLHNGIPAVTK